MRDTVAVSQQQLHPAMEVPVVRRFTVRFWCLLHALLAGIWGPGRGRFCGFGTLSRCRIGVQTWLMFGIPFS